jgi:DMSO/TMAO reductase YedYZ molybdopterin-dependent catalytic subunit
VPLHVFLQRVGANLKARYVSFKCFDGYSTSIDMPSALHPQTVLALDFLGKPLTPEWGGPLRLRIPTKPGFKSAKNINAISVTRRLPGTRVTTGIRSACLSNSVTQAHGVKLQLLRVSHSGIERGLLIADRKAAKRDLRARSSIRAHPMPASSSRSRSQSIPRADYRSAGRSQRQAGLCHSR